MLKLIRVRDRQRGFTLIEIMIALAISGILLAAIGVSVGQLFSINSKSTTYMVATKQVENALHYIDRDGQMASPGLTMSVYSSSTFPPGLTDVSLSSVPLTLKWVDSDNVTHEVTYSVVGPDDDLQRSESLDGAPPTTVDLATRIEPSSSVYSFTGRVLTVTLIADVPGMRPSIQKRTLDIKLRPTQ